MLTDIEITEREKPNFRLSVNYSWLGIECLVKTLNRGKEEKTDLDEIDELFAEDVNEPSQS